MLRRILMEPLAHFLVAGLTIFVLFSIFGEDDEFQAPMPTPNNHEVVVTTQDAERIVAGFRRTWLRQPTSQELNGLINEHIREEILVREAIELGLNEKDAVIRQRLRQKMEFLLNSAIEAEQASDESLKKHLATFPDRFTKSGSIAFEQVFLGESLSEEKVKDALRRLKSGENPDTFRYSTTLPSTLALTGSRRIDAVFGSGFWKRMSTAPFGEWSGPYRSGYGLHFIYVSKRIDAQLPSLAEARDLVEADWRKAMASEIAETRYNDLKSKYSVMRMDQAK